MEHGDLPMISVKTDSPISLKNVFDVINEIKSARLNAPVKIVDIILEKVAGLSCNIVATRNLKKLNFSLK